MRSLKSILTSWFFTTILSISFAQDPILNQGISPDARGENGLRIMFYNVENLFDKFDDPAVNDEEFTKDGDKAWTHYRYKQKLNSIAKTIIAVGGWEPPDLIGLCEVENFQVLMDLANETPLKMYGYQIVHENSKDSRGIDNALLFIPEKLEKIDQISININTKGKFITRDILYASFQFLEKDTIHLFVNHWTSRYGGKAFTEGKRILAANSLKLFLTGFQLKNPKAKLFIMGDFNDEPKDYSILENLGALPIQNEIVGDSLYNLSYVDFRNGKGTLTYKEIDHTWFLFDQMIVSGSYISGEGLLTKGMKNQIFIAEWLTENGRPFRTYQGPIYRGGFSDHLPIFIDLYYKE